MADREAATEIAVRPCRAADLGEITAIYGHAVRHGRASFELEPPDEAEMRRRHAAIVAGGYPYLVAERAGSVLGYAYASPFRPRPAYAATVEGSVYVRDDLARQGIGRTLLAALIGELEGLGFRQMVAVIGDSANLPSIRLHERLGFTMAGTLRSVGWKHERWLDIVLMQRSLGPGSTARRPAPPPPLGRSGVTAARPAGLRHCHGGTRPTGSSPAKGNRPMRRFHGVACLLAVLGLLWPGRGRRLSVRMRPARSPMAHYIRLPEAGGSGERPPLMVYSSRTGWRPSGRGRPRGAGFIDDFLGRGYAVLAPQGLAREGGRGPNWGVSDGRPHPRDDVAFIGEVIDDAGPASPSTGGGTSS
ncbi:MAG: N-acetyltransferase family protein [Geminicoccaceae bacterium]